LISEWKIFKHYLNLSVSFFTFVLPFGNLIE